MNRQSDGKTDRRTDVIKLSIFIIHLKILNQNFVLEKKIKIEATIIA
jgi:hypothetical protein